MFFQLWIRRAKILLGVEYFGIHKKCLPRLQDILQPPYRGRQGSLQPDRCLTCPTQFQHFFPLCSLNPLLSSECIITFCTLIPVHILFSPPWSGMPFSLLLPIGTLPFLTVTMSIKFFLIFPTSCAFFSSAALCLFLMTCYILSCNICWLLWWTLRLDFKFF